MYLCAEYLFCRAICLVSTHCTCSCMCQLLEMCTSEHVRVIPGLYLSECMIRMHIVGYSVLDFVFCVAIRSREGPVPRRTVSGGLLISELSYVTSSSLRYKRCFGSRSKVVLDRQSAWSRCSRLKNEQ